MANQEDDLKVLADNLNQLLQGELKVGVGLMKVGGCLKREGKNKKWIAEGLAKWVEENEDAIPLIATALGHAGIGKLQSFLNK
ncbi:MAG: hypothetical protein F6K48_03235 [Okeania sp. SIO3H1]|nr:hypothetical protein [Okeania sp. SIO3H1]